MNILLICDEYPPQKNGGIGTFTELLAKELVESGNNVVVYGQVDRNDFSGEKIQQDGEKITVIREYYNMKLPLIGLSFIDKLILRGSAFISLFFKHFSYKKRLEQVIEEYKIDIIEVPDWNMGNVKFPFMPFVPKNLKVPYVVRLHGSFSFFQYETKNRIRKTLKNAESYLYQNASGIISVSKYALEKYQEYYTNFPVSSIVIPNGIPSKELTNKKEALPPYKLVFFGTLTHKKGIYSLLKAWDIICGNSNEEHQLHIYGKGDVEHCKGLISDKAINRTTFFGHIDRENLLTKLEEYDIAVLPSYSETFGLAAIEAMSTGLATIFTERSTGPEIIDHKVNGLLVNPSDINSIVDSINYLLKNPQEIQRISENGIEKSHDFTIESTAKKTIKYYEELLSVKSS